MLNLRSHREMLQMRGPGILVWSAHRLAGEAVKPGVTTHAIDMIIEEYFDSHRATPLFKGVRRTRFRSPRRPAFRSTKRWSTAFPASALLKEGDIISVDTGCKLDGWCADAAFTQPVGHVSPEVRRLLDVTSGVLDLAIDLMGRRKSLERGRPRNGHLSCATPAFRVVENFVGHGIGRDMHEDPQVPNFVSPQLRRNNDFRLEPGLVIAVEPMVNMGTKKVRAMTDHWTQSTPTAARAPISSTPSRSRTTGRGS